MRRLAAFLASAVALTLSGAAEASAAQGGMYLREEHETWVRWSLVSNLQYESEIESAELEFRPGFEMSWALRPTNNHTRAITNVTLVLVVHGGPIKLTLAETYAGDPAQGTYAFFWSIGPGAHRFVPVWMEVSPTAKGPFEIHSLLFYENPDGIRSFSNTTVHGHVEGKDTASVSIGSLSVLSAGAALMLACAAMRRRPPR